MQTILELNADNIEEIQTLFKAIFTAPPWNDDWSNNNQLNAYIKDLVGNRNSLAFGLFEDDKLIGLSMGSIRHWYSGTEYHIEEFCISTQIQGHGIGTYFLKSIEEKIKRKGITRVFLQTERNVPAYKFYQKNGFLELNDHVSFIKTLL